MPVLRAHCPELVHRMPTPLAPIGRRRSFAPWLVLGCLTACSGGGSRTPTASIPSFAVLEVSPANGALHQGRRTEVRVRFSEPVFELRLDQLTVEDQSGPLPGLLAPGLDGTSWRWTPIRDLPYGSEIRIRLSRDLRSGSGNQPAATEVASFHVQDLVNRAEHGLGTSVEGRPVAAMTWTSGHIAALVEGQVHDLHLGATGPRPLPAVGEPVGFAQDDVGSFVLLSRQGFSPFVLQAVHGSASGGALSSTFPTSPSAFGRTELKLNARGDAAMYSYGLQSAQAEERLMVHASGTTVWSGAELDPAGGFPLRRLAIDGEGNPFVAYVDDNARLELQRYDRATNTSAIFDVAELPDEFQVGATGTGEARVFWHTRAAPGNGDVHLRLSRRYRDGQLLAAEELYRGERFADRAFLTTNGGDAVAVIEQPAGQRWSLQRFDDGRIAGSVDEIAVGIGPIFAIGGATRGEVWFVWVEPDPTGERIVGVRSRPGLAADAPREFYQTASGSTRIHRLAVAVEDGGRVMVVFTQDHAGPAHRAMAVVLN